MKIVISSVVLSLPIVIAGLIIKDVHFATGYVFMTAIALILQRLLISDVGNIFKASGATGGFRSGIYAFRFILRLAIFGLLFYVGVSSFSMDPIGLVLGFIVPLAVFISVFLFWSKDIDDDLEIR